MKSSLFGVGVAVMAIATSVMNTLGIAEAQLQKTQPNLNIPANSIQIPRNIKLLPSVSGNLEIVTRISHAQVGSVGRDEKMGECGECGGKEN
ncbi:MAG: hypothetical protein RMY28_029570 [Nostoc sp. ChiSLP01]|nr:hypothetical protein [Nostoc sp. CmiSLP01]MDZ8283520.1 hypothetical protein [Nostoc sp. ChiSLP01]